MNPSLGKSEPSPALEEEKGKSELEQKSTSRRRRKSGYYSSSVRRSQRITPLTVTPNQDIEPYVEDIIVSEDENDETDTQMEKVWSEPDANLDENNLKEKVDYMLQRLEALEKIIESLQAKLDENIDLGKTAPSASAVYRKYTDSQNQLEALREENQRLSGKLEHALGKVEVLEQQSGALVELLVNWKDVVMISNLSKSTERAVNASVQAIQTACAAYGGKRKRQATKS